MTLTVGSVCSGIDAPECAWAHLGWDYLWSSDIEPFPNAVREARFQGVPNLGDMTTIAPRILAGEVAAPDILVGGTPCQSFSVAGLRKGLDDERGNLALEFVRLAEAIDTVRFHAGQPPAWILWENVPGVLSDAGNAFGTFLAGLVGGDTPITPRGRWTDAGVVHGPLRCAAWRILDAQHFGLAQRRERVFVLARGGAGAWAAADALLPVIEGLRWHPAPRREAREGIAGAVTTRPDRGGVNSEGVDGKLVAWGGNNTSGPIDVAAALNACATASGRQDFESETFVTQVAPTLTSNGRAAGSATQQDAETGMLIAHTLRAEGFDASEDGTGRGTPLAPVIVAVSSGRGWWDAGEVGATIRAQDSVTKADTLIAHAFDARQSDVIQYGDITGPLDTDQGSSGSEASTTTVVAQPVDLQNVALGRDVAGTLDTTRPGRGGGQALLQSMAVRRLTPRECERLQGFPDDWTLVTYRGKPAADGPRYRALGNSMAVPVLRWIGEQIQKEHDNGG